MFISRIRGCILKICLILLIVTPAKASRMNRIVGGSRVKIHEFPWQAALMENDNFTCGAAIISNRHIVTAAHCVYVNSTRVPANISFIVIGSAELYDKNSEIHDVKSIEIHPGFTEFYPYHHDIAILVLTDEIKFDRTKSPIELPTKNVPVHAIVKFSGWGLSLMGKFAKHLEKIDFAIMNNSDCDEIKINTNDDDFGHPKYKEPLIFGQVCGLPAPFSGACEGDSGGALVYKRSLVGIFSWKYGCGEGYPNVFTRVYEYMDWIRETMART